MRVGFRRRVPQSGHGRGTDLPDPRLDRRAAREAEKAAKEAAKVDARDARDALRAGMPLSLYRDMRTEIERRTGKSKQPSLILREKEVKETFRVLVGLPPVLVRSYTSIGRGTGARPFNEDAQILARYGYFPTTQSFAEMNALTGLAVGMGTLVVSYEKRDPAPGASI